jgi:hypothetical protein
VQLAETIVTIRRCENTQQNFHFASSSGRSL